jgi:ECF transporter S component (folate family)
MKKLSTKSLIFLAFLIALEIILTRFLSINTPIVRIGFGFLPVAMAGILFGPLWAGLAYALGDVLGLLLFPSGPYFPGFTLSALLVGFTYGFFLNSKPITWKRVLIPVVIVTMIINLCLDTFWLYILMDNAVISMLPARLLKCAIMLPVQLLLIQVVWNRLLSKVSVIQAS